MAVGAASSRGLVGAAAGAVSDRGSVGKAIGAVSSRGSGAEATAGNLAELAEQASSSNSAPTFAFLEPAQGSLDTLPEEDAAQH